MEGTNTSKRRLKLKKNRGSENKRDLKQYTPVKAIQPQGYSTPLDSETVSRVSPTTVVEHRDITEDEDDGHSPFQFHCTQDTLVVGWDCGSPQHKSRKKLGSKVKRKLSKGNSFAHKKQSSSSCSPIEPLRPRRRFNIEKPAGDFSDLIPQLQVVADLVKNKQDQDAKTMHNISCDEICEKNSRKMEGTTNFTTKEGEGSTSNGTEEVLVVDIPKSEQEVCVNGAEKLKGPCDVTCLAELNVPKGNQNESFTALFDDDADEFMLQCSQEIEEKLNKNVPAVCSGNEEVTLPSCKKNYPISVQSKTISPEICNPARSLMCNSSNIKKPNSPKSGTKYYVRIKSGTSKYDKDEHPEFHSSLYSSSASVALHNCRTSTDSAVISSKSPYASEVTFDDSFDAVIQNLSEDDMIMLSQGHAVDKKDAGKVTGTESGKRLVQEVEDTTEVNCRKGNVLKLAVGQSSRVCRPSVNNQPVHQINSNRQLKYANQGTAFNETRGSRISNVQFQLKVPSGIRNNQNLSDRPGTVARVQLNKPCFNKDVPLVNNKVHVTWQGHGASAIKNSDVARQGSCATINSPAPTAVPKSSPHKCTPEEIQKKRLEAKKKLENKRLTVSCKNDKQYHHSKGP